MICSKHRCFMQGHGTAIFCPACKSEQEKAHSQIPSAGLDGSTAARTAKDRAIINLWNAMRDLSDYGEEALTEQDLQLWGYVTGHDAVQSRLDQP